MIDPENIYRNPSLFWGLIVSVLMINISGWADNIPVSPPTVREEPDSRFIQYTLPAGTSFQVLLQTPIDSSINAINDPVEAIMDHHLYLYDELVLPKNTRFTGLITELKPSIQGRNAILSVRFNRIYLKNDEKLPIVSHVRTERKEHSWGGEVTPGTKPVLSTQRVWGIGEYNRIVFAGPRAMGEDVKIQPGEHWTIILDESLSIIKPRVED